MKIKKPIIGITMSYDNSGFIRQGITYDFIRREYGEEVRRAGGEPIFLDNTIDPEVAAELCSGFVISGGQDIDPRFYGQEKTTNDALEPRQRTMWERHLITAVDKRNKHILGICYGQQLLNVHYGGTLYQDIAHEQGSSMDHGSSTGAVMHDVTFAEDFLGFTAHQQVEVASRHHQAVHELAPGFRIVAQAKDGVIEAISNGRHYGLQWHSESDGTAKQIYGNFVALCAKKSLSKGRRSLIRNYFV